MRGWGVSMETNLFVYIISHITITGYKTKNTSALQAYKIHHKLSCLSISRAYLNPPEKVCAGISPVKEATAATHTLRLNLTMKS